MKLFTKCCVTATLYDENAGTRQKASYTIAEMLMSKIEIFAFYYERSISICVPLLHVARYEPFVGARQFRLYRLVNNRATGSCCHLPFHGLIQLVLKLRSAFDGSSALITLSKS